MIGILAAAPLLVYLGAEPQPFAEAAAARGWEFAAVADALPGDPTVQKIEAAVAQHPRDPARTYLAGRGLSTAAVFYTVSRRPDLFAAAIAAGGGVEAAIETNRLFGAGAQLVPILWAVPPADQAQAAAGRARLTAKGFDIELAARQIGIAEALDWLAAHHSDPYPPSVDCETGSPAFAGCYWVQIAKFDPAARNDVLPSSRVKPGPGAYLALGGFGYGLDDPGPGILINWLPPNYVGPLKLNDRVLSVGGVHIKDARDYAAFMAGQTEERALGVVVERGKAKLRLEARIALAKRGEYVTARLRADFQMDGHQLLLITRGVGALRLDLPPYWVPCAINWNGVDAGRAESAGCWSVAAGGPAEPCNQEKTPDSGAVPPK